MHQQAITSTQIDDCAETPAAGTDITHFNFAHQVFKTQGARFLLKGHAQVPTFGLQMGDNEGLIAIDVLRKEFAIAPDSPDGKLLDMVIAGLRYVSDIRPMDAIPSEILSGTASWSINDKHRTRAEQRLQVQLVSWVSGKEVLLTAANEIEALLGQPENKEKLRKAFRDAAVALGYDADKPHAVVKQLELLARELCYIEALRDRFAMIGKVAAKLTELKKAYSSDQCGAMEMTRIRALMRAGIREYANIFEEADAQTGEIIAALKSVERQVKYIRGVRDKLHFLILQWEPVIKNLTMWRPHRCPATEKAMSELYRFLAPRYSASRSLLQKNAR